MLKHRVITASILAPLIILGILKVPTLYFSFLLGGILLLGAWEWSRLSGISSVAGRAVYVLVIAACLWLASLVMAQPGGSFYLLLATAFWWLTVITRLWRFAGDEKKTGFSLPQALIGIVVLIPPWVALVELHGLSEMGPTWVLFSVLLIWVADIGAYFSGRRWGASKLAPRVSPGKTRAGAYGALVGALVWGVLMVWYVGMAVDVIPGFLLLTLLTCAISIVGDLFESMMKRQRDIKDSGQLLPGHGGMLDRIDSITAAAPVFTLGIMSMGIIL